MIALLKAVYTDPTIPDTWYGYDYNGSQLGKIEYNLFASIAPWIKGANETYSDPYDDGMTLLLVQMKDGWY